LALIAGKSSPTGHHDLCEGQRDRDGDEYRPGIHQSCASLGARR
jgi:hypothetical protein